MKVVGIDHVQLAMPDGEEAKAVEFYEGVLGLPQVPKPAELAGRGGCWFELGSVKIHLGAEDDFRPARKAHPALIVDDLAEVNAAIEDAGFPLTAGESLDGLIRSFATDPFGNRVELMEILSEPS